MAASMLPEDVPAELIDFAMTKPEVGRVVWPHELRAILAAVLPAAYDMWRETAINDLDQLAIDGPEGWGLHCGDHTIIGASGEMTAGQVFAIALGHLASERHQGARL